MTTPPDRLSRSEFLRAGAVFAFAGPHRFTRRALKHELRILQWAHPTPGYDAWADRTAAAWGRRHDAAVSVDHVSSSELAPRARAEAAARFGHDLVLLMAPPTAFQNDVVPMNDLVAEAGHTLGRTAPVSAAGAHNPHTRRWFAFPDHFVPLLAIRRADLVPDPPTTWDELVALAPILRRRRHPVAIGLAGEIDSNAATISMLVALGGRVGSFDTPETRDYLRTVSALYRRGLPREVIRWNPGSNNQYLLGGRGALIVNPLSVLHAAERSKLPLAPHLRLSPLPGPRAVAHTTGSWVLWSFSRNRELAERFLLERVLAYHEHVVHSGFLNMPAWPGAVPDLRRQLPERYGAVADAAARTVGPAHPGPTDAAVQELVDSFIVPSMGRRVAQGKATPAEAIEDADRIAEAVVEKWREAKLI